MRDAPRDPRSVVSTICWPGIKSPDIQQPGHRRRLYSCEWWSLVLTARGLVKGVSSVLTRTGDPTIPLGLDAGGHDSMELKILGVATSALVRVQASAY